MKKVALLSGIALSPWANMPLGAYDENDPDTKTAVQAAIEAALEEQRESHEAEVEGLKNKNKELLDKLTKARQGKEDAGEVQRLESELEKASSELREVQSKLRVVERDLKKVTGERDNAVAERDKERGISQSEFVENKLTAALVEHKVAPHFMEAAKALLGKQVTVKVDGDNREAVVGDKALGDFVKEWAASEAGKHYVVAASNAGGGATPPSGGGMPGGLKPLAEYTEAERTEMARNRPVEWQQVLDAAQKANPTPTPVIA